MTVRVGQVASFGPVLIIGRQLRWAKEWGLWPHVDCLSNDLGLPGEQGAMKKTNEVEYKGDGLTAK